MVPRPSRSRRLSLVLACLVLAGCARATLPGSGGGAVSREAARYYRIVVVDADTGRGIPAVELRTTDARSFVTDSAGVVAFGEPDLLGKAVYLTPTSFGYSFPRNALGLRGRVLRTEAGGTGVIRMRRHNVAERLYRVTGSGIYRDSILLGDAVPPTLDPPELAVTGMDSVQATLYRDRLFWVWGDTTLASSPLGNFRASGATSELPGQGGLDPEVGVALQLLRDDTRLRSLVDDAHPVIWLEALRTARDAAGRERLFASYAKVRGGLEIAERGLVEFDDAAGRFRIAATYPPDAPFWPTGHPFPHREGGVPYLYYDLGLRSRADAASLRELSFYEVFTPLAQGARLRPGEPPVPERDARGRVVWGWKRDTSPLSLPGGDPARAARLPDALAWYRLLDVETGERVMPHSGSIAWNAYRPRWIMVRGEVRPGACHGGPSLGEVWYFEGDTPLGPWVYGARIVTHEMPGEGRDPTTGLPVEGECYSFYNPTHHPELDQQGGRLVYFEGTYSRAFTGRRYATPGYDYNQMMYRLDLADPRLLLPVPVYLLEGEPPVYRTGNAIATPDAERSVAFFAPDRPRPGTVAVAEVVDPASGMPRLVLGAAGPAQVVFHALPPSATASEAPELAATVPLFEFVGSSGERRYATEPALPGFRRRPQPLCRVWENPLPIDPHRFVEAKDPDGP